MIHVRIHLIFCMIIKFQNMAARLHITILVFLLPLMLAAFLGGCGRDESAPPDPGANSQSGELAAAPDSPSPAAPPRPSVPPRQASSDPEGIYLADGGLGYFLIDRDEAGALRGDGLLHGGDMFRVSQRGPNLIIESRIINPMFNAPADEKLWGGYIELAPSKSQPGDWDLRRYRHPSSLLGMESVLSVFAPDKTITADDLPEPEPWDVPSFLHRVDDSRVVEYFEYVDDYKDTPEILAQAKQLLFDHAADPWVRILYLDACMRTGQMDEMAKNLNDWKAFYDSIAQPELRYNLQQTRHVLLAHQRSAEGRNAWDYIAAHLASPETDLAARTAALPGLAEFDFCEAPFTSLRQQEQVNFLEGQGTTKVLVTQATLQLLQGRFDEARATMIGVYQWGWLMEQSSVEIAQMIGVSIRNFTLSGLETLALNAPDEKTAAANWDSINALPRFMTLDRQALDPHTKIFQPVPGRFQQNVEFTIRRSSVEARLANLTVAAALRLYQAQTGTFPGAGLTMLENLTNWTMPEDPFALQLAASSALTTAPSPPLLMAHDQASGALTVYSLGPDKADDGGAITYDPTNGTVSDGDILLRIPPDREFPFPAHGVRAASGEDVRKQFPNGLPRDSFADRRSPLSVTDAAPVRVWSWGPDTNQSDAESANSSAGMFGLPGSISIQTEEGFQPLTSSQPGSTTARKPYIPAIPYDPTNGIVSEGDIFIELPIVE